MKDIIEQSKGLIEQIKKSIQKVQDCENFCEIVEKGTISVYRQGEGTTYLSTVLSEEQMQELQSIVLEMIMNRQDEAAKFLEGLSQPVEKVEQTVAVVPDPVPVKVEVAPVKVAEPKPAVVKKTAAKLPTKKQKLSRGWDIDVELVKAEIEAGLSLTEIRDKHYSNRDYSSVCKKIKAAGLKCSKNSSKLDPDDFYTLIPEEELREGADLAPKKECASC